MFYGVGAYKSAAKQVGRDTGGFAPDIQEQTAAIISSESEPNTQHRVSITNYFLDQ